MNKPCGKPPKTRFRLNDLKFRELILYISALSQDDPKFGATKLNKLLFYTDFSAYRNFGRPISGDEYQKLDNGPAPRHLVPTIQHLEDEKLIQIKVRDFHGKQQRRTIANRKPDLSIFSKQEIDLINRTVLRFKEYNARDISNKSHLFFGWELAEINETIPYTTALLNIREVTKHDRNKAKKLAPKVNKYIGAYGFEV